MTKAPRSFGNDPDVFPQITADFAAALGYVARNWANVESILAYLICEMLGLNFRAAVIVTAEMSSMARIDLISALLFETRHQDWLDLWDGVKPELQRLRAIRNELVHATWDVVGDEHAQFYVRARNRTINKHAKFKSDDLVEVADQIAIVSDDLATRLYSILPQVAAELSANSPTLPPLVPGQGRAARAQVLAHDAKLAQKALDRARPTNRPKASKPAKD